MKSNKVEMLFIGLLVFALAVLVSPAGASPLVENPNAYLQPPELFLMNDAIVHAGDQNGYQLEISRYSADKYITCNPSLKYLYLKMLDGESQNYQIRLATKQALYPYTEDNPGVWYPGWIQTAIPPMYTV